MSTPIVAAENELTLTQEPTPDPVELALPMANPARPPLHIAQIPTAAPLPTHFLDNSLFQPGSSHQFNTSLPLVTDQIRLEREVPHDPTRTSLFPPGIMPPYVPPNAATPEPYAGPGCIAGLDRSYQDKFFLILTDCLPRDYPHSFPLITIQDVLFKPDHAWDTLRALIMLVAVYFPDPRPLSRVKLFFVRDKELDAAEWVHHFWTVALEEINYVHEELARQLKLLKDEERLPWLQPPPSEPFVDPEAVQELEYNMFYSPTEADFDSHDSWEFYDTLVDPFGVVRIEAACPPCFTFTDARAFYYSQQMQKPLDGLMLDKIRTIARALSGVLERSIKFGPVLFASFRDFFEFLRLVHTKCFQAAAKFVAKLEIAWMKLKSEAKELQTFLAARVIALKTKIHDFFAPRLHAAHEMVLQFKRFTVSQFRKVIRSIAQSLMSATEHDVCGPQKPECSTQADRDLSPDPPAPRKMKCPKGVFKYPSKAEKIRKGRRWANRQKELDRKKARDNALAFDSFWCDQPPPTPQLSRSVRRQIEFIKKKAAQAPPTPQGAGIVERWNAAKAQIFAMFSPGSKFRMILAGIFDAIAYTLINPFTILLITAALSTYIARKFALAPAVLAAVAGITLSLFSLRASRPLIDRAMALIAGTTHRTVVKTDLLNVCTLDTTGGLFRFTLDQNASETIDIMTQLANYNPSKTTDGSVTFVSTTIPSLTLYVDAPEAQGDAPEGEKGVGEAVIGAFFSLDNIKSCNAVLSYSRNVKLFFKELVELIMEAYAMFYEMTTGKIYIPPALRQVTIELQELATKSTAILTKHADDPKCMEDDAYRLEALWLDRKFKLFQARILTLPKIEAILPALNKTQQEIAKIAEIASKTYVGQRIRKEPLSIYLYGAADAGKSTLTRPVIAAVCKHLGAPAPKDLDFYTVNPNDQYWSGFVPTKRFIQFDDVLQVNDNAVKAKFIDDVIRIINTVPAPLNMAGLGEKGETFATPEIVTFTTNKDGLPQFGALCTEPKAIHRRLHIAARVERHVKVSGLNAWRITPTHLRGDPIDEPGMDFAQFSEYCASHALSIYNISHQLMEEAYTATAPFGETVKDYTPDLTAPSPSKKATVASAATATAAEPTVTLGSGVEAHGDGDIPVPTLEPIPAPPPPGLLSRLWSKAKACTLSAKAHAKASLSAAAHVARVVANFNAGIAALALFGVTSGVALLVAGIIAAVRFFSSPKQDEDVEPEDMNNSRRHKAQLKQLRAKLIGGKEKISVSGELKSSYDVWEAKVRDMLEAHEVDERTEALLDSFTPVDESLPKNVLDSIHKIGPNIVSIGHEDNRCTGLLIDATHIITCAHLFTGVNRPMLYVRRAGTFFQIRDYTLEHPVQGCDLVIIKLGALAPKFACKSLTKQFQPTPKPVSCPRYLRSFGPGEYALSDAINPTSIGKLALAGFTNIDRVQRVHTICVHGDSGTPVIDGVTGQILGFHIAGSNSGETRGFYLMISQADLPQGKDPANLEYTPHCVTDKFHPENTALMGLTPYPMHVSEKSKIEKSPFFGEAELPPSTKAPAALKPTRDGSPLHNAAAFKCKPLFSIPVELTNEIARSLAADMGRPIAKRSTLTLDEAIFGCPEINIPKLDPRTSTGPYWASRGIFKKSTIFEDPTLLAELKDRVRATLNSMEQGHPWILYGALQLKDELRTLKKVADLATRGIYCCNIEDTIIMRMYLGTSEAAIMANHNIGACKVGINPHGPEWARLLDRGLSVSAYVCDTDNSKFDKMKPFAAIECTVQARDYWYRVHYPMDDLITVAIRRNILSGYLAPAISCGAVLYQYPGTTISGANGTATMNSQDQASCKMIAFHYITTESPRHYLTKNSAATYGDDDWTTVAKQYIDMFNNVTYSEFAHKMWDMDVTMAQKGAALKPYSTPEESQFLKRQFVVRPGEVAAPLELTTLTDSIQWYHKGSDIPLANLMVDKVRNFMLEITHYGPESYEDWAAKMLRLCAKHEIPFVPMTYEQAMKSRHILTDVRPLF